MANYYCDHGAYGLTTNRLGLDVPAWGVPQEGDGSTKDAATAASVASVDLTSITSTAGAFSLFGSAAISVGASASGATLAAQIAAAINASSTTTGNTAVFPGAPQLRNAFYARATGAVLEIMCRIGSALTNVLGMTWAGTWSAGPPSNLTFSGGSGGCWGWFINPTALGVSSNIPVSYYGVMLYLPYAGVTPTLNDTVYVRTGGGASKTITVVAYALTLIHAEMSKNIVFDTNTIWTSDIATGTLKVIYSNSVWNISWVIRLSTPGRTNTYTALALGGFEIEYLCAQSQGKLDLTDSADNTSGHSSWHCKNVIFRDSMTTAGSGHGLGFTNGGNVSSSSRLWENCKFVVTNPRSTIWRSPLAVGSYGSQTGWVMSGCTFDFNISGVSNPGAVLGNAGYYYETDITFQNCNFTGFSSGYDLFTNLGTWTTTTVRLSLTVDNCSGLKMPTTYLGFPVATTFSRQGVHQVLFSNAAISTQAGMRIEDCRGVAEWLPDDATAFPYLSATLPGSGTPYSLRLIWVRAVAHNRARAYRSPDFRMITQLAAATRTLTLQALLHSTVTTGIKAAFSYIDSSGVARREDAEVIDSSSAVWVNAGSYSGFVARQFQVTTQYPVKANSEIIATVQLYAAPPGSDATMAVYVDPEFTVV